MFGMPNIAEVDGTIPPSKPYKDSAPEVSTSSCHRCIQAAETENSIRSQSTSTRPLHEFPHGSIKRKTSAVDTRSRLSVFGMPNTEKQSQTER
ncbi:hypothetical protein FB547_110181 [Variovorax beijingensis]|uniref:Uncharacterized protein n=1 Tax=Variovorax beijingensis TaxID=2496117 RepID=A0A561BEC8_9BURK|nr:hypothetical protein [Variovorax beijingensis]TWD77219.1 hypothetical protein FB547_110181 [Variovorax beijingensis]